jgi:hypothetical protein
LRHNTIQLRNFGGLAEITAPFDTAATIAALMSAASRAAAEVSPYDGCVSTCDSLSKKRVAQL